MQINPTNPMWSPYPVGCDHIIERAQAREQRVFERGLAELVQPVFAPDFYAPVYPELKCAHLVPRDHDRAARAYNNSTEEDW